MKKSLAVISAVVATLCIGALPVFAAQNFSVKDTATRATQLTGALAQITKFKQGQKYTLSDVGISMHVPPTGFNPLTATDAQLAYYGFPTRPTDAQGLANWTAVWSHYKSFTVPEFEVGVHHQSTGYNSSIYSGNSTPNWAGEVQYNGSSMSHFTYSQVEIKAPSIPDNFDTQGSLNFCAWTGIGGYGAGADGLLPNGQPAPVIQDGLWGENSDFETAWWEIYPLNQQQNINNFPITAGHSYIFETQYNPSGQTANFWVIDATTGNSTEVPNIATDGDYDGRSVEDIVEYPWEGAMWDFGTYDFSSPQFVEDGNSYEMNAASTAGGSIYKTNMVSSGTTLATSNGPISGDSDGSFSVTWDHY